MNEPNGLGMWIAFAGAAGGHEKIADKLAELDIGWVAPRAGESGWRDKNWQAKDARRLVARYHERGIRVYPWLYSRPWSWVAELGIFKALIDEGADGVIIDAETQWDKGQRATALRYMAALDKALPDVFVADAPWAYPHYHPGFPFAEFGTRVNARMPQAYWSEFDDRGARYHLPRIDADWSRLTLPAPKPVWPIGVTYGREHPSHPPGRLTVDDVRFFLERYPDAPVSLYSLEAARADVLQMLRERRKTASTS